MHFDKKKGKKKATTIRKRARLPDSDLGWHGKNLFPTRVVLEGENPWKGNKE